MGRIISLIRYRFFLFAGIFPYLLGQVTAGTLRNSLNWKNFWLGLLGIFLALCGVELFNEYFDAKAGGDRVFSQDASLIPHHFYKLGILVFAGAFFIALHFTLQFGWPILLFSFLGFLSAYFYVGPPLKLAYRGLGEIVIALSYGPLMFLGSYYLQTQKIDSLPFFLSLICALSIFCLSIINEVPDYYQDKLVGKKNLVVRLGKQKAMLLLTFTLFFMFLLLILGIILKKIPILSIVTFLILPWILKSLSAAKKKDDNPEVFLSVINASIVIYLTIVISLGVGYGFSNF